LIDIVGKDWLDCKIAHPGPIEIERLRRQRWTGKQIATRLHRSTPQAVIEEASLLILPVTGGSSMNELKS
jgi:hypothetical protein